MKITWERQAELYVILNNGRVLRAYKHFQAFASDLNLLARLQAQLARPEAFCDCKPTEETR